VENIFGPMRFRLIQVSLYIFIDQKSTSQTLFVLVSFNVNKSVLRPSNLQKLLIDLRHATFLHDALINEFDKF
jgi:hypothetical protein